MQPIQSKISLRSAIVLLLCLVILPSRSPAQSAPIGAWREHLPYFSAIAIAPAGKEIFCATPFSLFSVDPSDNSIERRSKINGLSEVGITAIHYNPETQRLLIAYANSNLDVLGASGLSNIPDIKRKNINGDKSIYNFFTLGAKAYLSTGLGVVVVNEDRNEISDTWYPGNAGAFIKVNGFTADNQYFYAATAEGLKRALRNAPNLADYRNWNPVSGLAGGPCADVVNLQNSLFAVKNDSVFKLNGANWQFLYADGWPVTSIKTAADRLLLTQRKPSGEARVLALSGAGAVLRTLQQSGVISFPLMATQWQNDYWVADLFGGLSRFATGSFERYQLNSPQSTASGEMVVENGQLWVSAGEVNDAWNYQYNRNGVYHFNGSEWKNYNGFGIPRLDTLLDFVTVAVDPRDGTAWAGSYGGGLLSIKKDGTLNIFKRNSPISPAIGDPTSYRVSGLAFDAAYNLWVANYGAPQNLLVRNSDGNWNSFTIPIFHNENAVAQILVDDYDQKWIVSPKGNGLFCFNHGSSIAGTADDRWKLYRAGSGQGNLPDNEVFCVAKDKDGFIWVGTGKGIGIIQCPQDVFTAQGCAAFLPIVQLDNFAGFLFQNEEVRSIAVDGANRKWVATRNGVWLISAEGEKVIFRFTEDNSPLLSNDVKRIAINQQTGEVYFSTFKGICSFRSTATEGGVRNEDVLVFPNPVPPGYKGTIAIRGLVANAIVKIAEPGGRLVFQTRALGGQAVWNGKDYTGREVAAGVYLVIVSDESRQEKIVTKIVLAR